MNYGNYSFCHCFGDRCGHVYGDLERTYVLSVVHSISTQVVDFPPQRSFDHADYVMSMVT